MRRDDWPQNVQAGRVLANFKSDHFSDRAAPQKWKSKRALRVGNSEAHLALIRKLPCTVCGTRKQVIHAHHLRSGEAVKERGVGMKCLDKRSLSLCWLHHDELHCVGSRREIEWFRDQCGIDPHALAAALWHCTGEIARMHRVLQAHRDDAYKRGWRPCQSGK